MESNDSDDAMDFVEIPIDGTLDLHTFNPRELKELIPDYLETCRVKGILQVRIIHGKGTGSLRRSVDTWKEQLGSVVSSGRRRCRRMGSNARHTQTRRRLVHFFRVLPILCSTDFTFSSSLFGLSFRSSMDIVV